MVIALTLVLIALTLSQVAVIIYVMRALTRMNQLHSALARFSDHNLAVEQDVKEFVLTDDYLARLRAHAEGQIDAALKSVQSQLVVEFQRSLSTLAESVQSQASRAVQVEINKYRQTVADAETKLTESMNDMLMVAEQTKQTLNEKSAQVLETERKRLIELLDTQFEDIISQYILGAFEGQISIGAQSKFIFDALNQKKADIKKDLENAL